MQPEELASYHGRETTTQALGRTWRFSRWSLTILDTWTEWAAEQLPDPLDVAMPKVEALANQEYDVLQRENMREEDRKRKLHFLRSQQERISRLAMEQATSYLAFNSQAVQSLMRHPRGGAQLLLLLLREHQPNVTLEDAFALANTISEEEKDRIMAVTQGKMPPSKRGN